MLLRELFEGGNLQLTDPINKDQIHAADEINLKVHNRTYMIGVLDKLLHGINQEFQRHYKQPLWSPQLLQSRAFLGGSSLSFFDLKNIPDEEYVAKKPKVGDIDTQCNKELQPQLEEFLTNIITKKVGNGTFLGFSKGNQQFNGLFLLDEPPVKVQIDFEFGRYDPETNAPDAWYKFSHSSEWDDISAGIKGVFHKYIYQALSSVSKTEIYFAKLEGRGAKRGYVISDEPIRMNKLSFAVSSSQGGGVSTKLAPYPDPSTGQPMYKNGIPVMIEVPSTERDYIQDLSQQFVLFFGKNPADNDLQLQKSFVGTMQLMNKYLSPETKEIVAKSFIKACFRAGAQMITRDDPDRDAKIKFVAIDRMVTDLKLPQLRDYAIEKATAYKDDYEGLEAFKKANPDVKQPRAAYEKQKAAQAAGLSEGIEYITKVLEIMKLEIQEYRMKIHEIINEGGTKPLSKTAKSSIKGAITTPDANNNAGDAYKSYRFGLALAGAPDYPTKAVNDIGGDPLLTTYTQEELEMIKYAGKQVGVGPLKKISSNRSEELPDTYKSSPVAKPKKNKYGV